jgi:hypothetical protein
VSCIGVYCINYRRKIGSSRARVKCVFLYGRIEIVIDADNVGHIRLAGIITGRAVV